MPQEDGRAVKEIGIPQSLFVWSHPLVRYAIGTIFAAILLVAVSLAIWHWRFVEVPDGIPKLELTDPLVGWTTKAHNQFEIIDQAEGPLLHLSRNQRSEKTPSIHVWLKPEESVSAIHIRCDARWENVKAGHEGYTIARIVSMMEDRQGKVMHPPGFGVTWGTGSRDWHSSEVVFLVTSDMADFGLAISMLGDQGTLEVKNLAVTALRNRPGIPAATATVLAGWVAFFFFLIRSRAKSIPYWRNFVASAMIVSAGWILVFPQLKDRLFPVIGSFSITREIPEKIAAPPSQTAVVSEAAIPPQSPQAVEVPEAVIPDQPQKSLVTKTNEREATPAKASESSRPPEPRIKPASEIEPVSRHSSALYKFLRATDRILPVAHFGLFLAMTLLFLVITGNERQWPLPLALAILSELVPELTDHLGGWDDWTDVFQNIAGVALAVFLYVRLKFLQALSQVRVRGLD